MTFLTKPVRESSACVLAHAGLAQARLVHMFARMPMSQRTQDTSVTVTLGPPLIVMASHRLREVCRHTRNFLGSYTRLDWLRGRMTA